jgi:putative transposase
LSEQIKQIHESSRQTYGSPRIQAAAKNILDRNFITTEPDRSWVDDITYIWTAQGWLYLAVIIDLFSRRVIGWSMAEHMRTDLILTALESALSQRIPSWFSFSL